MKNKSKIKYNPDLKIKISQTDIDNFPAHTLKINSYWMGVYSGK